MELGLWQYGLWSFQTGDTKLERLLPKNQHTQRKLLNFEFWFNGELSKKGHHSSNKVIPLFENSTTRTAIILVPLLVLLILSVGAAIALGVKLWKVNQHLQSKLNASNQKISAVEKNSENQVHENCSEVGVEEEEILNTIVSQNSN